MRLIDADLLKQCYTCKNSLGTNDNNSKADYASIRKMIDSQPTAYDVDKVVEQLETGLEEILYDRCYSNDYDMGMKEVNALLDKVMKGAVKDERFNQKKSYTAKSKIESI